MDEIYVEKTRYIRKTSSNPENSNGESCAFLQNGVCEKCICTKCRSGQVIYRSTENLLDIIVKDCPCTDMARNRMRMKKSGLQEQVSKYTFDNYIADSDWQKRVKRTAMSYCEEADKNSFFISGISGAGKTHLATAICNRLMEQGKQLLYFKWCDDSTNLKQLLKSENPEEYKKEVSKFKEIPFLYVDDFFKVAPTDADIRLAMEIINNRYTAGLPVIISSERSLNYISAAQGGSGLAVARRISEMCDWGKYCIEINGMDKIYRRQSESA